MIKLNDLNGLNESKALEKIYVDFLNYGKRKEKSLKLKYGFNDDECAIYIASGMFNQFMNYYEKSEAKNNNAKIDCAVHVYATLKTVINNMNFATYDNVKSVNLITVIDVIKQWENRDSRSEAKYCRYYDGDETFKMSLVSNYGNPESELMKKEALNKLHALSSKIRSHKKYSELMAILTSSENQTKAQENFLCYFKKSNGLKCSSAELLELVSNY